MQRLHPLKVKNAGIDTYRENIIFMHSDCEVCRSEGFTALTRLMVRYKGKSIIATLNVVHSAWLAKNECVLSMEALVRLGASEGDFVSVSHLKPVDSLGRVRAKMYGKALDENDFREIIADVVAGRYSNIEVAAFITSCSGDHLSVEEITGLTRAMIGSGQTIKWNDSLVLDKHCIGGLPGNRTSPIVVSIIAAAGLRIPKTSSRAITSSSGTADTMEVMTHVNLPLEKIREIVDKENGCLVWGGSVGLSPADDILISVEKALDVDSEGQMIASVLSKKASAGSTHVVIEVPVGATAKVRSHEKALKLQYYFKAVAEAIGMHVEVVITEGEQPVGRGIGPALEAMDVLAVLRNEADAPEDLKKRALVLAGALLELSGKYPEGRGNEEALALLESGKALEKFMNICRAQGGFKEPQTAAFSYELSASRGGIVRGIDNRKLARLAKLAGAPRQAAAGVLFFSPLGKKIGPGEPLFRIYSGTPGELEYAKTYLDDNPGIITIGE